MKLTIGMIVKNEEKWLDKCLSAIKPILNNVDSELIITDTGSTDKTVEIAKRYTDNVLHFDWVNDFAAARNTGIKAAHGEWFMFLDADEIFKSCDSIIRFFNSDEYKNYNSAAYTVRNMQSDDSYSDFEARRMTKLLPETHFNGVIHEHFSTHGEPIKYISDIAYHYGYIYNDDAERIKKFDRNYALLKEKFEQIKDNNPMIYAEMYDTLALGEMQAEADEYLEAGVKWCLKHEHPILILLYCKKARHLLFEQKTEAALKICDEYFSMSSNIRPGKIYSDVEILAIKSTALYRLEKYNEAITALIGFFGAYTDAKSGKLNTRDKMYGTLSLASDSKYLSYVGQFLVCCINTGKFEFAADFMAKLPLSDYGEDKNTLSSIIDLEISLLKIVGSNHLYDFFNNLDDYGKRELKKASDVLPLQKKTSRIVLTIGMIVKNEEKYLDRCLSAIKPILDNVDSELVITDTGSTDRTVEIAQKYTDNVLHFNWCNDFAAARNTGIKAARGEWFMFLDADEIFKSHDNIIRFFNSGEYKKYNSATFIVRNFTNDKKIISDFRAQRLTKITPQTRFEGIIHETLNTFGNPIKHLPDIADHYGYVFENKEEAERKSKRNTELLLKRLENTEEPDPMTYVQLYDSFTTYENSAEADKYMSLGIECCKTKKSLVLAVLYVKKAYAEVSNDKYNEAISTCKDYMNMDKSIRPDRLSSDREILAILAASQLRLKNYPAAEKAFAEFFDVYEMTENGSLDTPEVDAISFRASAEFNYLPFVSAFLNCCLINDHYDLASEYLKKIPIYKYSDDKEQINDVIRFEIRILERAGMDDLEAFCKNLDDYGRQELIKAAERLKNKTIKLTVGMIVKNEEARLDKCLSSIKPLLDNVDSELIITDTGSTDRTVEIAKKYTDNVLHFDWCDDFSAARNTAFAAAKGEWFMFVDADDVFAEYDDLIAFFNSDECEKYGSASFTYRNIRSEDKQDHIDQYVIRIVRRFPQTRFVGRIHEVLDPMPEPIKKLDTIVEHYGYFYNSGNDAAAKMKRNERILLKELEEAPEGERKSILLYYYLYEELREQETGKAERYLDTGIEKALETKSDAIIPLIHEKARIYLSRDENEAVLRLCDEYFALDGKMRAGEICADTEIYAVKAVALMRLERYNETMDAFRKFFRLFDLVNSGKLVTGDRYIYLPALSGDGELPNMIARFTDCCDRCGNIPQMEQFLNSFPVSRYVAAERQADLFFAVGVLMKNDLDISPLLFGDDRQTALTASLCCDNIDRFYDISGDYSPENVNKRDILPKAAILYEIIINKALKNNIFIDKLVQRFIDIGTLYTGDSECESIKLSRVMGQADTDRKNGRYKECLAVLKSALNDFPDSVNLIKGYINIVSAELERTQKAPVSSEMEKLAMMLKTNVKQMISAGNYDTAKKYLNEYAKIAPGDLEIEELRNMMK